MVLCWNHRACAHYPNQQLYDKPLDEAKFKKALIELCMDAGEVDMSVSAWVQCARAML